MALNVLILACNMGGGHFSAAYALDEELSRRGVEHETLDALTAFASQKVSDRVSGIYTGIVKHTPRVFGIVYRAGGAISSSRHKSPVYFANLATKKKMAAYLNERRIDVVLLTHLFPAQTLTALKAEGALGSVRTIAVGTDYTCIPFWEETDCDCYVLPHADLTEEYIRKGVPEEKLRPLGIPTSARFLERREKTEARRELGLPEEGRLALVMTGSMGYGHVAELTGKLLECGGRKERECGKPVYVAVVCGNNRAVFDALDQTYSKERLFLYGFERRIPLLMDACDVLLTKPGGLTSTEAAAHGVPLVHTTPIPGCETCNAAFFQERGMSVAETEPGRQAEAAVRLCFDRAEAEALCLAQRREINARAAADICDLAEELYRGGGQGG